MSKVLNCFGFGGPEATLKRRLRKRAKNAISRFGFSLVKNLGSGSFGDVYLIKDRSGNKSAMKIVKLDAASYGEEFLWKDLRHENVLPLANTVDLPNIPAFSYIMPVQDVAYFHLIESAAFYNSPDSLATSVQIIKDIVTGLEYLHKNQYAHMDLKTDNILISSRKRAKICDFTFLTRPSYQVRSYGAPLVLRPPEACPSKGYDVPVDGRAFDCWTTGLLVLDALTRHVTANIPTECVSWTYVTRFELYQFLLRKNFADRVRTSFPGWKVSASDLATMRNFILMFLASDPDKRPSMTQVLRHRFLGLENHWADVDVIWREPGYDDAEEGYSVTNLNNPFVTQSMDLDAMYGCTSEGMPKDSPPSDSNSDLFHQQPDIQPKDESESNLKNPFVASNLNLDGCNSEQIAEDSPQLPEVIQSKDITGPDTTTQPNPDAPQRIQKKTRLRRVFGWLRKKFRCAKRS